MQIKIILNRLEKYRGFVFGKVTLCNEYEGNTFGHESLVVEIKPRKNSKARCSICQKSCPGYDSLETRLFEYIPLWGFIVFFAYRMRRVSCKEHGVVVEYVPWAVGKNHLTTTYGWFLSTWAKRLAWDEVAVIFKTSWHSVYRAIEMAVEWGLERRDLSNIKSVGIDEIARQKGHKYLTVVYQIDGYCRRLLWIGRERKEETLNGFFNWLGEDRVKSIEAICSDMWKPYLKVIRERAGHVLHVLDRFHIVAKLNKAIDEVRADEARKLAQAGKEPVLSKSKWILLKRKDNLTASQGVKLKDLLKYNLRSVRAYLLKESFGQLWEYKSVACAKKYMHSWCTEAMRSKIEPMKKIARMIRSHEELLLNWFRAKGELSSGIVEGNNTKAKLIIRKSYGFRTENALELALYHGLGELPVPEFTHRY